MKPTISSIQIQTAAKDGRWYAKETSSADKSEKTLVFFQRSGPRSLRQVISDKLNGVKSGRAMAEKYLESLGLQSASIRSDPKRTAASLREKDLNHLLQEKIAQVNARQTRIPNSPGEDTGTGPAISVVKPLTADDKAYMEQFATNLWKAYKGDINKTDFMRLAKAAFLLGEGDMTMSDDKLVSQVTAFLNDSEVHPPVGGELERQFNGVLRLFRQKSNESKASVEAGRLGMPPLSGDTVSPEDNSVLNEMLMQESAEAPPLENRLLQSLNEGRKEEFCSAITREFARLHSHERGQHPEKEISLFRTRIARAFDIAKDEQRVQARIESVGSDVPQAKQLLYLSANREIPVSQHAAAEALSALDTLLGMGTDPDTQAILRDMRGLIVQARDQSAYDF